MGRKGFPHSESSVKSATVAGNALVTAGLIGTRAPSKCQVQLQVEWSLFAVRIVFLSERLALLIYDVEDSLYVCRYSVIFASSIVEFKHHSWMLNFLMKFSRGPIP